jgi:hypothetical protein
MAYDAAHGQTVLFGGYYEHIPYGDTWTWDGTDWTRRTPVHAPSPRWEMGMAYDAAHDEVVLFGGTPDNYDGEYFGDTWTWDGTDWTQRTPAHAPSPRYNFAMASDGTHGQVLLFGGVDGSFRNDTWAWNGTDWTEQTPEHAPSPREVMGMAEDDAAGQVVFFGGLDGYDADKNDTWTWDGTDWTQHAPVHAPSPRWDLGMAYDAAHGQVVLFGGVNYNGPQNETWTWDGADWTQQTPVRAPALRWDPAMAFDATQRIVMFGGGSDGLYRVGYADTWAWDGMDWRIPLKAHLHMSVGSGPPGTVVHVTGTGFAALEEVTITFIDSVAGKSVLGTVPTDQSGVVDAQVMVPRNSAAKIHSTEGEQRITAVGAWSDQKAKAKFTVT